MQAEVKTSTADGVKSIKTIFHWQSAEGKHSHCLLRIYADAARQRAAVVASELESNRQNPDIGCDFKKLASAIARDFGQFLGVPMQQVTWLLHYGTFSAPLSYENLGFPDEFSKVELPWEGTSLGEGEGEWIVFRAPKIREILDWATLEPVEEVLSELNLTSPEFK